MKTEIASVAKLVGEFLFRATVLFIIAFAILKDGVPILNIVSVAAWSSLALTFLNLVRNQIKSIKEIKEGF